MSERPGPSSTGSFRQQAITTANLLLEAAERLEVSLRRGGSENRGAESSSGVVERPASASSGAMELRRLFNWTSSGSRRTGEKRKAGQTSSTNKGKKRKRSVTWTHTYICLAHPDDDTAPTSMERAALKLAGLGEKRFPVDATCTSQEFYDEILIQFPKIRDGGGYELLRVSEGGGRMLEVIPHPDGGMQNI